MRALLDRIANFLHAVIALACTWIVVGSPWIGMYQQMPEHPSVVESSHVVLGFALLPAALVYLAACVVGGRWRLYFPWLGGHISAIGRDVAGIARGHRPTAEGGGLFATIEGLLLIALLATAASGALWYASGEAAAAIAWRGHHIIAARALVALFALHLIAVALHFLDFIFG
jgi:hypothetical protein